ncbi:MAG: exodeoxyribonuclease VII large subunit, partial [Actinomycetota bacterium]|nr:exodeoxyribonuclease VII large subunit [Actinomycetota bacterium]
QARRALTSAADRQDDLVVRLRRSAEAGLSRQGERLDSAAGRLVRSTTVALSRHGDQLTALTARLRALDPAAILARGWSITRRAGGDLVRSTTDVRGGDALETRFADGTVRSTVD